MWKLIYDLNFTKVRLMFKICLGVHSRQGINTALEAQSIMKQALSHFKAYTARLGHYLQ